MRMPNEDTDVRGNVRKRVFIGNLPAEMTLSEFLKLIPHGCEVTNIEVKQKHNIDGEPSTSFAFLTVNGTLSSIKSWCNVFSRKKYNGKNITVEFARESFLDRLQRELKKAKHRAETSHVCNSPCKRLVDSEMIISEPKKIKHSKKHSEPVEEPAAPEVMDAAIELSYDADAQRRKSLAERSSLYLNQLKTIKESLDAHNKLNRKIIFDEESTSEKPTLPEGSGEKSSGSNLKKQALFSSDESDNDEKYDFSASKPAYKLIETKYSTFDERFRLDDRFLEDESEQVSTENKVEDNDEDEKINSILSSIIGETSKKKKKPKESNIELPTRFNPLISEHKQYLAPTEDPTLEIPKETAKKDDEGMFKVTKEKFYHVSEGLAHSFKKEDQANEFSLLGMFGESHSGSGSSHKKEEEVSINLVGKNFFRITNEVQDSSGEEDNEDPVKEANEIGAESQSTNGPAETLFFSKNDERLKASLQFFKEPLSSSEPFSVKRNKIKKIIDIKHKKNINRLRSFSTKLGGNKRKIEKVKKRTGLKKKTT